MTTARNRLEETLAEARRLPENEQLLLVAELQANKAARPIRGNRRTAMKHWLALAGSAHIDVADTSSCKNEHLTQT